ncbi:MAG: DsbA family protein [Rhodobacterales bacterium]|nr:DsbA family protein [Rhodobacterales bacterium]
MNTTSKIILAATLLALPYTVTAQELSEARIKELVYEAILENPDIIMDAVAIIQQREEVEQAASIQSVLTDQRVLLESDPNAPVLGNPDGDVTVIEFFDYNCPFCKRVMPEVQALLEADPDVRLVYREWPILGEGSVYATRAALASREQGKYEEFHWALMGAKGRLEEASVLKIAKDVGLDIGQLIADMQSDEVNEHIETSMRLAQFLGFNGTPSFVIGDMLLPGFIEQDELQQSVDKDREN